MSLLWGGKRWFGNLRDFIRSPTCLLFASGSKSTIRSKNSPSKGLDVAHLPLAPAGIAILKPLHADCHAHWARQP